MPTCFAKIHGNKWKNSPTLWNLPCFLYPKKLSGDLGAGTSLFMRDTMMWCPCTAATATNHEFSKGKTTNRSKRLVGLVKLNYIWRCFHDCSTCALRDDNISASATYSTYVASDWEQSIETKNRKEQLSSQCPQTFQVEADCLGKSDAYLHTHTHIYIYRYDMIWYANDPKLWIPSSSAIAASSQGGRPRVRSSYLGFRLFHDFWVAKPCRGWAMLGSKLRQGRLLLLLLLVAGLWVLRSFRIFWVWGNPPRFQAAFRSSCSFCNRLMGSHNLGFDSTTGDAMMRCDEMWWDVMRYARSSWLSDTFCSFRML